MNKKLKLHALILGLLCLPALARAQGTAFTYQGRLSVGAVTANGSYDLAFSVFDDGIAGNQIGNSLTNTAVAVSNGLFVVTLDFGTGVFDGTPRWLEIGVRTNGDEGDFAVLAPRQSITPTPYAIFAANAATAATATTVASGAISSDQLFTAAPPADNQVLAFSGGSLLWTDPVAGGSVWSLSGLNAYYNAGNVGIGTSTPHHRLGIIGGPSWTANGWAGSLEFANGSALGWQANAGGQHHGIGQSTGGLYFFHTASDPGTTASPANYTLELTDNGNVLVGPPNGELAGIPLQVNGAVSMNENGGLIQFGTPNGETGMSIQKNVSFGTAGRADIRFDGSTLKLLAGSGFSLPLGPPASDNGLTIDTTGDLGVAKHVNFGNSTRQMLNLYGTGFGIGIQTADLYFRSGAGFAWHQGGTHNDATYNPGAGGQTLMTLDSGGLFVTGPASVCSLTIRGGCDLAEPFQMNDQQPIEKGSVVVIDSERPGRLTLSTRAYDTRVAGIVSGANGVNTALALLQEGTLDAGQNVALTGRVYVLADASNGAINPGDMLTTSDTPGHAMKVGDHSRAQGAVLGKAMTSLANGKGMVLVLVTLQ